MPYIKGEIIMALKTFPNGLRLAISQKEQEKLVAVAVHITSGSQCEKNKEMGITEYVARMLKEGIMEYPNKEALSNYIKEQGFIFESKADTENLSLSICCTTDRVQTAIDLLCKILFTSKFDYIYGEKVRQEQLEDIQKEMLTASHQLNRMTNQALYYRTGLSNPKLGTVTSVSRFKAYTAREHLKSILTPKNTIISIAGDINADDIYEYVMKSFYTKFLEESTYKKLKYVAEITDFTGGIRTKNKRINQSRILLSFPSISFKHPRKHALNIAKEIFESRLKRFLNETEYYYHSEEIIINKFANNGNFSIYCAVDYEHTEHFIRRIIDFIRDFVKGGGITSHDFELEKNIYTTNFILKMDNMLTYAKRIAREIAVNKQPISLSSELLNIEMTDSSDANKIFKSILNPKALFISYLGNPIQISEDIFRGTAE